MVGWAVKASLLLDEGLELAWVVSHNLLVEHFHMHQAVYVYIPGGHMTDVLVPWEQ